MSMCHLKKSLDKKLHVLPVGAGVTDPTVTDTKFELPHPTYMWISSSMVSKDCLLLEVLGSILHPAFFPNFQLFRIFTILNYFASKLVTDPRVTDTKFELPHSTHMWISNSMVSKGCLLPEVLGSILHLMFFSRF